MFERVTVVHDTEEGKECYLCIGKHFIFFVSKEMDRFVEGRQLSYLHIEKAVSDSSSRRIFLLELVYNRDSSWENGNRIVVLSQHREALLDRIGLCWQAEYMFRHYAVKKFPQAKANLMEKMDLLMEKMEKINIDHLQVKPFKGYEEDFKHRGYSFFLRSGFKNNSGLRNGTFTHDRGWEVSYNSQTVVVPGGVETTVHVNDPQTISELERSSTGADDLRTVAMGYKQALTDYLDQFYVLVNCSYMKRMNRMNDVASWDGWEFFIRSKEFAFACVLFRRMYIPPLCDTAQDLAVILRCPVHNMTQDTCEVILDECRFIADSLASTSDAKPYRDIIQARLDTLQFNEEAYRWIEGQLNLTPVHRRPAAIKFVSSLIKILIGDGQFWDESLQEAEIFKDIPFLHDPLLVPGEMLSDAEGLLGSAEDGHSTRDERRNAWYWRIARYLSHCVDGGIMNDRFNLGHLVQAVGKGSPETDRILRQVVEFLLHVVPRNDWTRSFNSARLPWLQLLQDPEEFSKYSFNERMMRLLLTENYIANEWKKKATSGNAGASYEKLLASLLISENIGLGLRTLICRQILESTSTRDPSAGEDRQAHVFVPALLKAMQGGNLSLSSCATAALVNLSCDKASTKTLLVSHGCIKILIKQLRMKDEDLTLYTLYLLVNLTKLPHHRSIVCRQGGVPVLVDILTSSYQNLRKEKTLSEICSVVGQLCNDEETRSLFSDDFPVVLCLLWVYDAAQPNTKLKAKVLFALRQLCLVGQNKIKVGQHAIPRLLEELSMAAPSKVECAMNSVLLLTMLASVSTNARAMNHQGRLDDAFEACGLQSKDVRGQEAKSHKFGPQLWLKVVELKERIRESEHASGGGDSGT